VRSSWVGWGCAVFCIASRANGDRSLQSEPRTHTIAGSTQFHTAEHSRGTPGETTGHRQHDEWEGAVGAHALTSPARFGWLMAPLQWKWSGCRVAVVASVAAKRSAPSARALEWLIHVLFSSMRCTLLLCDPHDAARRGTRRAVRVFFFIRKVLVPLPFRPVRLADRCALSSGIAVRCGVRSSTGSIGCMIDHSKWHTHDSTVTGSARRHCHWPAPPSLTPLCSDRMGASAARKFMRTPHQ